MGIFTRKHEQDAAPKAASMTTKATPAKDRGIMRILRRIFKEGGSTQSGSESISLASSSDQAPDQRLRGSKTALSEVDPEVQTSQSLWDRAYDALRDKEAKLVDEYETVLSQELQKTSLCPHLQARSHRSLPPMCRCPTRRRLVCAIGAA